MTDLGTDRLRFAGLSRGALTWIGAWVVGAAIARLTGAAAVLLVLAAAFVAFGGAVISARRSVKQLVVAELSIAALTSVDVSTPVSIRLDGPTSRQDGEIRISDGGHLLAAVPFTELDAQGTAHLTVSFPTAGVIDVVGVELLATGPVGAVWMRRRVNVGLDPVAVAPQPISPGVPIKDGASDSEGLVVTEHGPKHGEVDGIRMWRDGDGDASVHWPSTLRSGALVVHDRQASLDRTWIIDVPSSGVEEHLAGRLAHTMLEGLRFGHEVILRRTGPSRQPDEASSADILVTSSDAARRHSAEMIGEHRLPDVERQPWYRRTLRVTARTDTFTSISPTARWLSALASLISLGMLIGALGVAPSTIGLGIGGLVLGALVSLRVSVRDSKPLWLRVAVTAATLGALASIATTVGGVNDCSPRSAARCPIS